MKYCVYKHTSPNGKVYIGITSRNPLSRWKNGHGYKNNPHFWNAIVKYGWDNFKHEILFDGLTKDEACEKEVELIAKYKSNEYQFGFNRSSGGEFAGSGVFKSNATKQKISRSLTGRKMTEEEKRKSAEAHIGLKRSEETKRKMSEIAKKRGVSEKTREKTRTQVVCVETGKVYSSINEAARCTGILRTSIGNCCCGRSKSAGKYTWIYATKNKKK